MLNHSHCSNCTAISFSDSGNWLTTVDKAATPGLVASTRQKTKSATIGQLTTVLDADIYLRAPRWARWRTWQCPCLRPATAIHVLAPRSSCQPKYHRINYSLNEWGLVVTVGSNLLCEIYYIGTISLTQNPNPLLREIASYLLVIVHYLKHSPHTQDDISFPECPQWCISRNT